MKSISTILAILIALVFSFQLEGKKAAVFPELMNPKYLIAEDGKLFVSDYPYLYIYSLKDFKQVKKTGGIGRGPGDFYIRMGNRNLKTRGLFISKYREHIAACSEHKVSFFNTNGEFSKIVKSFNMNSKYISLGDKFLCFKPDLMNGKLKVFISDMAFENKKKVYEGKYWANIKARNKRDCFFDRASDTLLLAVGGQKIFFIRGDSPNLTIARLDFDGNFLPPIKRETEKLELPDDFLNRVRKHYLVKFRLQESEVGDYLKDVDLPEYYPAVRNIFATDQRLFVITFKKNKGLTEILVFSTEGKYLTKTFLPVKERNLALIAPSWFSDDTFYQLVENEKTDNWELFITPIN